MSSKKKVLLIVEGEVTEKVLFERIETVLQLDLTICCFKANIYTLYKKLEELDFNADIKQVLSELQPAYKEALSDKFVYTYLIFDFDAHHPKKHEDRTLDSIVHDNIEKIKKMTDYFIDETDPTIGKIYINYPMIESFRACDEPFDPNYQNEFITLQDLNNFKEYAGTKRMAQKRLDTYSRYDFKELTKMNIFKLGHMMLNNWGNITYHQYLTNSNATAILERQAHFVEQNNQIAVLNTSFFIITDYFGNQRGFFNYIMR